jgi:hypothetical protein
MPASPGVQDKQEEYTWVGGKEGLPFRPCPMELRFFGIGCVFWHLQVTWMLLPGCCFQGWCFLGGGGREGAPARVREPNELFG